MTTRKNTKNTEARKPRLLEVAANTPESLKAVNCQIARVDDAHGRMLNMLEGMMKARANGQTAVALDYHMMLRQEVEFLAQVADALLTTLDKVN